MMDYRYFFYLLCFVFLFAIEPVSGDDSTGECQECEVQDFNYSTMPDTLLSNLFYIFDKLDFEDNLQDIQEEIKRAIDDSQEYGEISISGQNYTIQINSQQNFRSYEIRRQIDRLLEFESNIIRVIGYSRAYSKDYYEDQFTDENENELVLEINENGPFSHLKYKIDANHNHLLEIDSIEYDL